MTREEIMAAMVRDYVKELDALTFEEIQMVYLDQKNMDLMSDKDWLEIMKSRDNAPGR